jgi:hypothetical protein
MRTAQHKVARRRNTLTGRVDDTDAGAVIAVWIGVRAADFKVLFIGYFCRT